MSAEPPDPFQLQPELSGDEFRQAAHAAVDWVASYLERLGELPVLAQIEPGELLARLPPGPPAGEEAFSEVLQDMDRLLLPAMTNWAHPRFFAYFNSSGSAAGIVGEILSAGLNVNAMLWRSSPAATELELATCGWLAQLMGLPERFSGHINDTASVSTLVALAGARESLQLGIRQRGMAGRSDLPRLRVYASDQAHSSVEKAVVTLGMGQEGFAAVPSDERFRMVPQALGRAIEADLAAGIRPCAVVATAGTTATTSIDPLAEIADICERHRLWLHVDAAHGGAMAVVPEWRGLFNGWERAQSLVMNPHKWLFTPLDCSVLLTTEEATLRQAFSLVPEYLTTPEEGREGGIGSRNLMDLGVSLGRRMRALKLWLVIRRYGSEGLAQRIRQHVELAQWLRRQMEAAPEWEVLAPTPMATVCFRHHPAEVEQEAALDAHNRQLMATVNGRGKVFISHAQLGGRLALRASIGGIRTMPEDVSLLWEELEGAARA